MNLLDLLISPAMAQAASTPQGSMVQTIVMIALFFFIFFVFIIRPQSKRAKEHREMITALAKGDEVVTSGGIAGKVEEIKDSFIHVEIAQGVQIKVQKHAIAAVLPKGTLKSA